MTVLGLQEVAALSNSAATIIGSIIGVFGLIFVALVGFAWRSINRNLNDKFDNVRHDQRDLERAVSNDRLLLINHGERIAYLEGQRGVVPGTLHRAPSDITLHDIDPRSGG